MVLMIVGGIVAVLTAVIVYNHRRIRRLEAQVAQLGEVADVLERTRRTQPRRRGHLKLLGIPAAVLAADHLAAKASVAAAIAIGALMAGTLSDREGSRPLERTPPAAAELPSAGWRAHDTTTTTVDAGTGRTPPPVEPATPAEGTSPGTTPQRGSPTTTLPPGPTATVTPPAVTTTVPPVDLDAEVLDDDCVADVKLARLLGLEVCVG